MTSMPNSELLKTTFLAILEALINRALALDPGTLHQLEQLNGKVIHINCSQPELGVYIIPHHQGVMLQHHYEHEPDTSISGSASALLKLVTSENQTEVLFNEDVTISGSTDVSQKLQNIMADLDIDWEAKLAEFIGDIPAHHLGNQVRGLTKWGHGAIDSMIMNLEEYLHEEARALPPRAELEYFYREIEKLSQETDRIAAKLATIRNRASAKQNSEAKDTSQ